MFTLLMTSLLRICITSHSLICVHYKYTRFCSSFNLDQPFLPFHTIVSGTSSLKTTHAHAWCSCVGNEKC